MMRFNLGPMFASDLQLELGTIGESACFSAQKSRLPGRLPPAVVVVAVVCCFACVARSLKAAATAIIMQISTVKMPINIPIDTIGVSSNSACARFRLTFPFRAENGFLQRAVKKEGGCRCGWEFEDEDRNGRGAVSCRIQS
uniref:Uncharacterized protein n=1 Tax=Anopheles coluzzii TaxID=1518534 RepID=A0A8W7P2E3_ANOCL